MPRDHAQMRLSIWDDDDFRSLPGDAQHLYWMLLMHPELSYCGVMDWRPAKLSGFVGDWTADTIRAAADVLIERLYIVVDEGTEEVLVRSFVRHDGLMKQPKMATAMATAHSAVGSIALRGVVVGELQRLHREDPELKGWGSEKASALLSKPSIDPTTYPCGKGLGNPPGNPSTNPSREGSENPNPEGSGKASVSPSSLLLAPSSLAPSSDSSLRSESGNAPKRAHRIPDDFEPDEQLRQFARDRGFTDPQIGEVTASFVRYWRAKSGRDATKLDWPATWQNWVVKEDPRRVRAVTTPASARPAWEDFR